VNFIAIFEERAEKAPFGCTYFWPKPPHKSPAFEFSIAFGYTFCDPSPEQSPRKRLKSKDG
jgi:hypothetical protein